MTCADGDRNSGRLPEVNSPVVGLRGEGDARGAALTREMLDEAFEALLKRGSEPRHDCRFDDHVLQWNPSGFAWCIYCHASEADLERPTDG